MKNKPYYYTTNLFTHTYHGGGCSPEHLKGLKRGEITNFSRQSQKRLCLALDSIKDFVPKYKIKIEYIKLSEWDVIFSNVKAFCRKLSKERFYTNRKVPLYVWKKNVSETKIIIEIITNEIFKFPPQALKDILIYLWNTVTTEGKIVEIEQIIDKVKTIYDFCLNNNVDSNFQGRFWGMINKKYYEKNKIKKIYADILEITQIEAKEEIVKNNNIKKNIYIKCKKN